MFLFQASFDTSHTGMTYDEESFVDPCVEVLYYSQNFNCRLDSGLSVSS